MNEYSSREPVHGLAKTPTEARQGRIHGFMSRILTNSLVVAMAALALAYVLVRGL